MGRKPRRARKESIATAAPSSSVSEPPFFAGTVLILVATLFAYVPAIRGDFVWDDDYYVTNNPTMNSASGLRRIWTEPGATPQYYPLVFTTFWVERRLWDLAPAGYHIVNVLLHVGSAVFVWRIARRLCIPGALAAGMLFALHPVQVESVAWITERKNVLSGVFYFAAMWYYIRFARIESSESPSRRAWRSYVFSVIFFLCALLSKTVTASLPAVILIVLWWRRGRVGRTDMLALVPMFALGAGLGLHTAWLEQHHVGAAGEEWNLTFVERFLVAGRAIWFYLWKLLLPINLTFIYTRWEINASSLAQYAFPTAAIVALLTAWLLRKRIGRAPLAVGVCFAGTLFPALGFLNVYPFRYSFVADHFQYIAAVFVLAAFAALGARMLQNRPLLPRVGSFGAVALVLIALTWRQSSAYDTMGTLWRDVVSKNPSAWMAYGNLGDYLSGQGKHADAADAYRRSLEIRPKSPQIHFNLGLALSEQGKTQEAMEQYRLALEQQPTYPQAWVNLGAALIGLNKYHEAQTALERAIAQDPRLAAAHYNMGNLLMAIGRFDDAYERFRKAEELRPRYVEAIVNAGNALLAAGRIDEAEKCLRRALELSPHSIEALLNLGSALIPRDPAAGRQYLEKAIRLRPDFDEAHYRLARSFAAENRLDDAIRELEKTLKLNPKHPQAQDDLRRLMERKRN